LETKYIKQEQKQSVENQSGAKNKIINGAKIKTFQSRPETNKAYESGWKQKL
jgi:hypothetical protein